MTRIAEGIQGKSFISGVNNPVERTLRSCILHDPSLGLIASEKILYRQPSINNEKVILLSGGGSGHEPAHAGYLGEGALDVVVAGEIFASPSESQILAAMHTVRSSKGTLMIAKNYTGDKLNFGLAAEKAKANGHNVNMVVVGDDVSVEGNSLVGQRGLAGVVFVHKVSGAKAAKGANLDEVTAVANRAASQMATAAASLDRCSVPGRAGQEALPHNQLEFGMGIHNEPGVVRESIPSLESTVQKTLDMIFTAKPNMWHPKPGLRVALMVNNLGGLSLLELGVVADEVVRQVVERGIKIDKSLVGTFVTSLDGPGFSATLLQLDEELKQLLDAPTTAPAWPRSIHGWGTDAEAVAMRDIRYMNGVDTYERETGFKGLVDEFESEDGEFLGIGQIFRRTAITAERSMGGTSGAIYAIFLNAVANNLTDQALANPTTNLQDIISSSLQRGLDELCHYTPARIGHRTLMDALIPFVKTFAGKGSLRDAVLEACKGAESTRQMAAALGRASYVGRDRFNEEGGIPDPGALGVVSILRGMEAVLG
ncbi:hypothetical protein BFJ71_g16541 [Fusarium oxysporum]|nr:hypothetical protein BFJ71_g16541 [Fusarium oxysporum]